MPEWNPYQPPSADVSTLGSGRADGGEFVPPRTGWGRAAAVGLGLCAATSLASIPAYMSQATLLGDIQRGQFDVATIAASDARILALGIAALVVFLGTAVSYCIWLAGACRTARSVAPGSVSDTPGWAVGWYFVPVANLFKPYQSMKEIVSASVGHVDPRHEGETPTILPVWWAALIVSSVLERVATRMLTQAGTNAEEAITGSWVQVLADGTGAIAALAALVVVLKVVNTQARFKQP